ncbi:MAG: primosomal protein N' [Gammaproteobacteria bacterium]|nr:primosomal protein N' [Gammaproteobacteria bacterium]
MIKDKPQWICKVCIPNTYSEAFDYAFTEPRPAIGARVLVPFRKHEKVGIVLGFEEVKRCYRDLKSIIATPNEPPLCRELYLQCCRFIANYYHIPLSEILALALPRGLKDLNQTLELTPQYGLRVCTPLPAKLTAKQQALIALLTSDQLLPLAVLKKQGFSQHFIDRALSQGLCDLLPLPPLRPIKALELALNEAQSQVLAAIEMNTFQAYLLNGVTGSGKTEVYIEAMKKVLAGGGQALMLVPEIGLTTGLCERIAKRLTATVVMMHSGLSEKQRFKHWLMAYHGQAQVVIGTRSALFAPLPQLALIIIDEEHDLSFRQTDGVRYSAKDAAVMRAKFENIPIVLGTATPALETFINAKVGRYRLLELPAKALNQHEVNYRVVDLRAQKIQHGFADTTLQRIKAHLDVNEQVLVFVNRRGYAPILYCHDCAVTMGCSRCDANMTMHRGKNKLVCHHCQASMLLPKHCPKCFSSDLQPLGFGTEQLDDFLKTYFPSHQVARFDRDILKTKTALAEGLRKIHAHEVDIIVATQILAKGHHFAKLGLVVIVDADSGFYQSDFRALERLGQMIVQVSGRTGREKLQGEVCIQTHLPTHPLLMTLLKEGYAPFAKALLAQRQEANLPPFRHMALLRVEGRDALSIQQHLQHLVTCFNRDHIEVLGPMPAPMERKANIHRYQLIFKAKSRQMLHRELLKVRPYLQTASVKGIRAFIEVDPYDWSA